MMKQEDLKWLGYRFIQNGLICRTSETIDIGLDIQIKLRCVEGAQAGLSYWHPNLKNPDEICEDWVNFNMFGWTDGWDVEQEEPLTISPSLLCHVCGNHGFIREGRWIPA
jgi:hypothetical protein